MHTLSLGKIILIASILWVPLACHGESAPKVVRTFISCTEKLSELPSDNVNKATQLQQTIQHCFAAAEIGGLNIRNSDLFLIGAYPNPIITSEKYSIKLKALIFDQRAVDIRHKICNTVIIKKPDQGKDVPHLYKTTVNKSINYENRKHEVWQQLIVPYDNNKHITKITTQKEPFDDGVVTPDNAVDRMTADELLDLAAEFYSKKNLKSAYDTYSLITNKFDSNAEGWYRLAIMTYYNKGCTYAQPKELAKTYMRKAYDRAQGKLRDKANNVLHYWEHSNFNSF